MSSPSLSGWVSSMSHLPLLLLGLLGSLLLHFLDALLRVALVAAVGLDLYVESQISALKHNSLCSAAPAGRQYFITVKTHRTLAITRKSLVPLSFALLLLLELLLLQLLGLFRAGLVVYGESSALADTCFHFTGSILVDSAEDVRNALSLPAARCALA